MGNIGAQLVEVTRLRRLPGVHDAMQVLVFRIQALFTTLRGTASFYKWRAKYGGMDASFGQMKAMEDENRRLKRMYADLSMQADLLKEVLGKK